MIEIIGVITGFIMVLFSLMTIESKKLLNSIVFYRSLLCFQLWNLLS